MIRYKTRRMLGIWIACMLAATSYGQINGSFEGIPPNTDGQNMAPPAWANCNNTPDVQPGTFGVTLPASDGRNFVGMVTDYDSWTESIGQAFTFASNQTYAFKIDLAYASQSGYCCPRTAGRLNVWAGNGSCAKSQLIWTSPVATAAWTTYSFNYTPTQNFTHLILESNYPGASPTYSNILLDNLRICNPAPAIAPAGLLASRNKTWPVDEVINLKTNYTVTGVSIDSVQWKVDYLLNGVTEFTRIIDNPAGYAFERGDTVIVRPAYFCGGAEIIVPVDGPARPTRIVVDDGFDQKIQAVWPKADENVMIVCEVSVLRGSKTYYKGRTGSNGKLYVQGIKSGDQLVLKSTKLTKPYCEGSFTVSFSGEQATPVSITLSPDFADLGLENN